MLKESNLANRIDGVRKTNSKWEFALETSGGELEWFPISVVCLPVEDYIRSYDKISRES